MNMEEQLCATTEDDSSTSLPDHVTSTVIVDLNDMDYNARYVDDDIQGLVHIDADQVLETDSDLDKVLQKSSDNQYKPAKPIIQRRRKGKFSDILPQQRPFICPFKGCGKESSDRIQLRRHYRNHQERKHVCQFCGQKFLYLKDKRIHERTHTGERPYICQVCDKAFIQKCTLANHLITHSKEAKSEVCDLCGRAYYYKKSLAQHKKEKHGSEFSKDLHFCPLCGKKYMGSHGYNLHLEKCKTKKVEDKTFSCQHCGIFFQKESHLKKHTAKNECAAHVYQCGVCNLILSAEVQLRKHMQTVHNVGFDDCIQVQLVEGTNLHEETSMSQSDANRAEFVLQAYSGLGQNQLRITENPT